MKRDKVVFWMSSSISWVKDVRVGIKSFILYHDLGVSYIAGSRRNCAKIFES